MLTLFRWSASDCTGRRLSADEVRHGLDELRATADVLWVDLDQPDEAEERLVLESLVPVHTLTLEDITRERRDPKGLPHLPKVEEFPDYLFVIVNPLHPKLLERLARPPGPTPAHARTTCQLSAVLTA